MHHFCPSDSGQGGGIYTERSSGTDSGECTSFIVRADCLNWQNQFTEGQSLNCLSPDSPVHSHAGISPGSPEASVTEGITHLDKHLSCRNIRKLLSAADESSPERRHQLLNCYLKLGIEGLTPCSCHYEYQILSSYKSTGDDDSFDGLFGATRSTSRRSHFSKNNFPAPSPTEEQKLNPSEHSSLNRTDSNYLDETKANFSPENDNLDRELYPQQSCASVKIRRVCSDTILVSPHSLIFSEQHDKLPLAKASSDRCSKYLSQIIRSDSDPKLDESKGDENRHVPSWHEYQYLERSSRGRTCSRRWERFLSEPSRSLTDLCGSTDEAFVSSKLSKDPIGSPWPTKRRIVPPIQVCSGESETSVSKSVPLRCLDWLDLCPLSKGIMNDCAPQDQEQSDFNKEQSPDGQDTMMKAARDLAQAAAPALSALQYLPGVLNVLPKSSTSPHQSERAESSTGLTADGSSSQIDENAKSKCAHKLEHSGLLHRLCFCDCMAHSSASPKADRTRGHNGSKARSTQEKGTTISQVNLDMNAAKGKRLAPSPDKAQQRSARANLVATGERVEAQSPSFLNLLEATSARRAREDISRLAPPSSINDKRQEFFGIHPSSGTSSTFTLASSGSGCALDSLATSSGCDSPAERPSSAAEACEVNRRSKQARHKVFSPTRLFSCLDDRPSKKSSSDEGLKDLPHQSFIARSLQRLSYRSHRRTIIKRPANSPQSEASHESSVFSAPTDTGRSTGLNASKQTPDVKIDDSWLRETDCQIHSTTNPHLLSTNGEMVRQTNRSNNSEPLDSLSRETSSERAFSLPPSPRSLRRAKVPRLAESPVFFKSPASPSSKIEDGLHVCSVEHFEKHIGNIRGAQIESQKRLFTVWINYYCPNLIRHDLVDELRDGVKLLGLLSVLSKDGKLFARFSALNNDKRYHINRLLVTPSSRLRHLSNVTEAITFMRTQLGLELVNLNPMDIVSGKPNVVLGLCWTLILHYQLERNLSNSLDFNKTESSEASASDLKPNQRSKGQFGSDSPVALADLRRRLLEHLNNRLGLKLTHLSTNMLDGDVLKIIIRRLASNITESQFERLFDGREWASLNELEKLDHCFSLAQEHLNVPILFSASDLRQQTISDNNVRPLLIYLSMLVSAPEVPIQEEKQAANFDENDEIACRLQQVECEDKFEVHKLKNSLGELEQLETLAHHRVNSRDTSVLFRLRKLRSEAAEVEKVFNWINEADKLFDIVPASAADLESTIATFRYFFATHRRPSLSDECGAVTLKRQLKNCIEHADQLLYSMEQTLQNWHDYELASRRLRDWLEKAENLISSSVLRVFDEPASARILQDQVSRLNELIEFFELKPDDGTLDGPEPLLTPVNSSVIRLPRMRTCPDSLSRKLFIDFELKCRLLAAMLDVDQREALVSGVRRLKEQLRCLTEERVPEVISELRMNIAECQSQSACNSSEIDESLNHLTQAGERNQSPPPLFSREANSRSSLRTGISNSILSSQDSLASARCKEQEFDPTDGSKLPIRTRIPALFEYLFSTHRYGSEERSTISPSKSTISKDDTRFPSDNEEGDKIPLAQQLWLKLVRAYNASFSLNVILLICLAGLCLVPLINREACCELTSLHLPNPNNLIPPEPKPT